MALLEVIGNVATVITIISFLTGLIICRDIYRARSTGDFSSFPFAAGTLCTFLWLRYGLLLADPTMIFVNSIGFTLQTCYLIWFYFYTVQRAAITRQLLLLLSILFSLHFYTRYSAEPEVLVAPFASLSSLLFCASPLASVSEVVRTRSTAKLPFALILSSFVVSSLWFSYGYLLDNSFVMLPNGIGALISGMQLSLFALYPNKSKSQNLITNGYRNFGQMKKKLSEEKHDYDNEEEQIELVKNIENKRKENPNEFKIGKNTLQL